MSKSSLSAGKGTSAFGRGARRILWSLPDPVKNRLSAAYRRFTPASPPTEDIIDFPPDIADREELRTFLADTDIFGSAPDEGLSYLSHALERFRITIAITPHLEAGSRTLELGSNPYFFTRMLERKGIEVTCANWFGEQADIGPRGRQLVSSPRTGVSRVFEFDHFNIESDRFPYPDETFSLVFFCEILEHLPLDPVNALAEIHRVLSKPDGVLVLSTPNPSRSENLVKMLQGENVYEPLSGYGVHGRHNREYTVSELSELLDDLGFDVDRIFTADISPAPPRAPNGIPGLEVFDRGEYVFAVARANGPDRWRYPEWLYQSRHALSRAVLPDLVVGRNDDLQCQGFHGRETMIDRDIRWMGKEPEATVLLSPPHGGQAVLQIEGAAPPEEVGGYIELRALVNGNEVSDRFDAGQGWFSVKFPVEVEEGDQHVVFRTDRTWRPIDFGLSADDRELSLAITSVGFARSPDQARTADSTRSAL
jgi:SAM-dependent methyltransferase